MTKCDKKIVRKMLKYKIKIMIYYVSNLLEYISEKLVKNNYIILMITITYYIVHSIIKYGKWGILWVRIR